MQSMVLDSLIKADTEGMREKHVDKLLNCIQLRSVIGITYGSAQSAMVFPIMSQISLCSCAKDCFV